ncbi:hypothetical protein HK104_005780 [Borealophlyctis nickersoniae]|nr:hypothetical protein HK104_005780 [Borealophlyctis nickersoniae]
MRPNPAVALHETAKISEAAAYMAAKRQDAVLVVDAEGRLAGILTDKDLAYRVVAEGLDPRSVSVSTVMTANPVSVTASSDAIEALNKMVAGHFRHLPVVESDDDDSDDGLGGYEGAEGGGGGGVVGVLDITKCLYEALEKLDRAYDSSRRLTEALEGVEREWSINSGAVGRYAEELRTRLACPDLAGLLAAEESSFTGSTPSVSTRATVLDAAREMKMGKETAVLVFGEDGGRTDAETGLVGIFTSKDLVLRVLAAGLDPATTSVVRVMTPHPDCVSPNTPVVDALRKMHAGRYLHLPVVDTDGGVHGMVDVLKLTYTTLTQMTNLQGDSENESPMWNKFWDSALNSRSASETSSQVSEAVSSVSHTYNNGDRRTHRHSFTGPTSPTFSNFTDIRDDSTVAPDDSASMFTADTSALGHASGPDAFVFKLKDEDSGKVHRFTNSPRDLTALRNIVREKLQGGGVGGSLVAGRLSESDVIQISYVDDEGDYVHLTTDRDLEDAVIMAKAAGWARLILSLDAQRVRRKSSRSPLIDPPSAAAAAAGSAIGSAGSAVSSAHTAIARQEGPWNDAEGGGGPPRNLGMITPLLIGSGVAVGCAFLLGRAFR